jgi:hypothetical protein
MIVLAMKRLTQTTGRFKIISGCNSWQIKKVQSSKFSEQSYFEFLNLKLGTLDFELNTMRHARGKEQQLPRLKTHKLHSLVLTSQKCGNW